MYKNISLSLFPRVCPNEDYHTDKHGVMRPEVTGYPSYIPHDVRAFLQDNDEAIEPKEFPTTLTKMTRLPHLFQKYRSQSNRVAKLKFLSSQIAGNNEVSSRRVDKRSSSRRHRKSSHYTSFMHPLSMQRVWDQEQQIVATRMHHQKQPESASSTPRQPLSTPSPKSNDSAIISEPIRRQNTLDFNKLKG